MLVRGATRAGAIAVIVLFATVASNAGETVASLVAAGLNVLCAKFGAKVSGSEGNFGSDSPKYHCLGAFQFCPGTFEIYYKGSAAQFLANPMDQVTAWTRYERTQWGLAVKYKLTDLIGSDVCIAANTCKPIDASAILMACQFGCGNKGKLANYRQGRNCDAKNVKDGNQVSVCTYLYKGSGYNVSCFTGVATDVAPPSPDVVPPSPPGSGQNQVCPPASRGKSGMEIVVNNFTFRFDEDASPDAVTRIFQLLRSAK